MTKLNIETLLKYTSLSHLEKSPNGTYLAFVSSKLRLNKNDYINSLYIHDGNKTKRVRCLKNSPYFFWENDSSILYFDARNNEEKDLKKNQHSVLYRYDLDTGKSYQALSFPFPISDIKSLEDALLIQTSLNEAEHVYFDTEDKRSAYLDGIKKETNYEEFVSVPFYSDGGTYTKNKIGQAFVYKNDKYYPLGDKDESISNVTVSKDKIYYTVSTNIGIPSFYQDLRVFDVNKLSYENITNDAKYSYSKLFVLKDTLYFLGSDKKDYGMNQNPDFYKVSSKIEKVLKFGRSANNTIGSDVRYGQLANGKVHNDTFVFIGTYHHHSVIYTFDGETLNEEKSLNSIDTFEFYNDSFYTIEITESKPQEVYKDRKQLTRLNTKALANKYVAKPIHHEFVNDGVTLDGWVLLPENYEKGKSYPSVLNIHGGPKTIYSSIFYNEMQVWANLGYVVYFTNPRGGDCYEDDFADIRGKYGTIDYEDIMAFTDLVEKEYQLDPKRMGVTGGSYGGFMTNWIVGHTDRFSAAITQRSISNWTSFAGTSDIGAYFAKDQTAADPVKDLDKAWNQSPLKYSDNIKTPLLFIHSDQDYRCPMEQALQLYSRVKLNGVDTKLVWFKNENHNLSRGGRPQGRIKRLTEITNWLELYLK